MKEIYSKACRVVIWLVSPKDSLAQDMDRSLTAQTSQNKRATVKAPRLSTILHKLLRHPYWTRVWVVQEVVVACKAHIYYGGHHYNWDKFVCAARDLHTEEARTVQRKMIHLLGLKIRHLTGLEKVIRIDDMRRHSRDAQPKEETFLPMILMRFFTSQATNPIDRVFAFLGISKDIMLEADYSRLDTDIYKEVALHALQTKLPKLRFVYFSACGLANNPKAKWSWVPDLRRLKIRLPFPLWDFWQYAAGGGAYSDVKFLKPDRISVEGVLIDRIRTVSKLRSNSTLDKEVYVQLSQNGTINAESAILTFFKTEQPRLKEQFEMVNEGKDDTDKGEKAVYTLTGQTLKEAFLRTLLCDTSSELLGSEISANEYGEQLVKLIKADEKVI
jgi:Heterokaryon incompatibility protein (HET)